MIFSCFVKIIEGSRNVVIEVPNKSNRRFSFSNERSYIKVLSESSQVVDDVHGVILEGLINILKLVSRILHEKLIFDHQISFRVEGRKATIVDIDEVVVLDLDSYKLIFQGGQSISISNRVDCAATSNSSQHFIYIGDLALDGSNYGLQFHHNFRFISKLIKLIDQLLKFLNDSDLL